MGSKVGWARFAFQKDFSDYLGAKITRGNKSPGRKALLWSRQRKYEGVDLGGS